METAVISYRVADFLKQYAPFHAIEEADLLALAGDGRVRFHEPNEYILWQGEPHRLQVFVIQQGTVSLWEEMPEGAKLRDVRGAGDMLGLERYSDARSCLHSARSESDVVMYAFPASDFETFVLKYPHAVEYVEAESRVTPNYQPAGAPQLLPRTFAHDVVRRKAPLTCGATDSIAHVARQLLTTRSEAVLVLDATRRARGVVTGDTLLNWVAAGAGSRQQPVETLLHDGLATIAPDVSVTDGLLTMAMADVEALVITDDGTADGRVQTLVTRRDLAPLFGDDPVTLLRQSRVAATTQGLLDLNQRARAFILSQLAGASTVAWLARFASLVDTTILTRVVALAGDDQLPICWCFGGAAGRAESLTRQTPTVLAVFDDELPAERAAAAYRRVLDGLLECGYLSGADQPFDAAFYAARASEWRERYRNWIRDPVGQETYRARALFDVRPVSGDPSLWQTVSAAAADALNPAFIHLMANDCLDSLPPLTFLEDAVIDRLGEHAATFRLEYSALQPLVDVGRVFALAAGDAFGRSTLERFAIARAMLPDQEAIFREASDTLQIVLWQQGRVGISNGTSGAELPAVALSRHDRHVLKSGFRSILRLLEFTGNREWLKRL